MTTTGYLFAPLPEALVYDSDVDPLAVRVYAVLMRHGLDPAACFPSHRRIAELIGISQRSVQRPLVMLEQRGWIERVPRFDERGDRLSDGFHVHVDRAAERVLRADERGGSALTSAQPPALTNAINESNLEREPENERESEPAAQLARLSDVVDDDLPAVVKDAGLIETARELCLLLEQSLLDRGHTTAAGKARTKRWLLDMEALLRLDERKPEHVRRVIRWLARGDDDVSSFWRGNVHSPNKLRLRWDRMSEQYQSLTRKSQSRTSQQFDRAVRDAGHDPREVAADTDALVRSMFGRDDHEPADSSPLTSGALDVMSREG